MRSAARRLRRDGFRNRAVPVLQADELLEAVGAGALVNIRIEGPTPALSPVATPTMALGHLLHHAMICASSVVAL